MEETTLHRLKETIAARVQNITDFITNAPADTVKLRVGPAEEQAVTEELTVLNSVLKKADEHSIGLCDVCHDYIEASRLEMDYTASVCLEHMTGAERSRLESDLELSAKVQQALLPHALPAFQNIEIAAYSQPARIVGGDYFDFLRFKDGSHAVVIADVMGKGMPASMLMASLQASLRIIVPESLEPSEVVARLNHLFCHNIRLTNFVTIVLMKFNEQTGVITYCNAGHNPPVILTGGGTINLLQPTGAAIGLIEQTTFGQKSASLHAGDTLLLYTDGVVESFNPAKEMFGQERLEEYLREHSRKNAQGIVSGLKEVSQKFAGTLQPADDTTIIAMKVLR